MRILWILETVVIVSLMHSARNRPAQAAAPTQLVITPLIAKLNISWTPGTSVPLANKFKVYLRYQGNEAVHISDGSITSLSLNAEPCMLITVGVCGLHDAYAMSDCIYGAKTPYAEPPPPVTSVRISNTPESLGQLIKWEPPDVVNPNCDLYYQVQYEVSGQNRQRSNVITTSFQTYNLPWNTRISYKIHSAYRESLVNGNSVVVEKLTDPEPDLPLSKISVTVHESVLKTRWQGPVGASFYIGVTDNAQSRNYVVPPGQTWFDIKTTKQCTVHFIWLAAFSDEFQTRIYSTMAKTKPHDKPFAPTNVKVYSSCGTLNVTWTHQMDWNNFTQFFEVKATGVTADDSVVATVQGVYSAFLSGLTCDQPYMVTVRALNACGWSPQSAPVYVIARNEFPPTKISSLTLFTTENRLDASWRSIQSTLVHFTHVVRLEKNDGVDLVLEENLTTINSSVTFERLTSCVTFTVSVIARNPFGLSEAVVGTARTWPPVPRKPNNLNVQIVGRTIHNVSWDTDASFPPQCQTYFEVNVASLSNSWKKVYETTHPFLVIAGLNYTTTYAYRVRVRTELDHVFSRYTAPVIGYTLERDKFILLSYWSYIVIGAMCSFGVLSLFFLNLRRSF